MNVLVLPEDDEMDRFILKPLFEAMLKQLGKPHANITVHHPRVAGWGAVKKWSNIEKVIDQYSMVHLFILCVDRDGHATRRGILDGLEEKANGILEPQGRRFFAVQAHQEIEVWALAGIRWKINPKWSWDAIRAERDPKERYFAPIAEKRRLTDSPGAGRSILGAEAASHYGKIRQNCNEVAQLEERIREWIGATSPESSPRPRRKR